MYRRFLRDEDYLGIITKDSLAQLTRGNNERFIQAEEAAEMSIVEYLSENYEIEIELNKGKYIAPYTRSVTYPIGAHIEFEDQIFKVIRSISGYKAPTLGEYWEEHADIHLDLSTVKKYSQFGTYYKDNVILYNDVLYKCLIENGYDFGDIRIPLVNGWLEVIFSTWLPIDYMVWDVVKYEDAFYTLLTLDNFDNNINPLDSDNWGAIADYTPEYNNYQLNSHEYVVYNNNVFYPETDVNSDLPLIGTNLILHDPRNFNLKKHMVRLAVYELTKLIAPNNVSVVRMRDYEDSMKWLSDASRLKINPQIPRKLDEEKKPVTDWQLATFQSDYDPYKNPWLT